MSSCRYDPTEWNGAVDVTTYEVGFEFGEDGRYALEVDVTGPCPRCGHVTTDGHPLFHFDGFAPGDRDSVAHRAVLAEVDELLHAGELPYKTSYRADLLCKCGEAHDGQPSRASGCGVSWSLTVSVPQ
ncbi:MAG: hypothetical protein J2P29_05175 [Actinobacteria bacterium]|nr:hypothetical protein [Actinomycetota bacterium]